MKGQRDKNGIGSLFLIITVLAALSLAACGGGGGGSGGGTGATSTPVSSFGAITAKGSIFVNGVEFETEGAQLEMENEIPEIIGLDDGKLKVGMVVEVEGTVNDDGKTGRATRIRFDDTLRGKIESVEDNGLTKKIVILGQTVIVEDNLTKFDDNDPLFDDFAELEIGDVGKVVVVSGLVADDSSLRANFIGKRSDDLPGFLAAGGTLELKGAVSALNTAARTFTLNGITVNYANAALRDLPPTGLANGMMVEVKGQTFDPVTSTLTAADIQGKVDGIVDDAAEAEVEGFVAELNTGAKTFKVNGQSVNYAGALFLGGLEADLANGVKVEAEGPVSGGVLNAEKVVFKESLRFEGNIASFSGNVLTLGNFSPAISVRVDANSTVFKAGQSAADLLPGQGVKIRARQSGANLVATRIEAVNPFQDVSIQGPVTAINGTAITLLGITIDTATIASIDDSSGESNFKIEDVPVSRAAFLAALGVGDIVKAKARISGDGSLSWKEVEIEMED